MKIEQIYTACLSQAAYYIESAGEAAIIDPLRDIEQYLKKAKEQGSKIKYIFETHFHADFVSGHLDLARQTKAPIVYGPMADANFEFYQAQDRERFTLGDIQIEWIHTPGHTLESSVLAVIDEEGEYHSLFTGDTLFLGDVGRPDLAVKSELSSEDLAKHLYHSIYHKILPMSDDLILYPGHGAGSACGKHMSKETIGTLGSQKQSNYALQNLTESEFVKQVLDGLATPPQYFPKNALLNKLGYSSSEEIKNKAKALDVEDFAALLKATNVLLLDVREASVFHKAFIPNSMNVGLSGQFASWIGTLVDDLTSPILLVAPQGDELETVARLSRVGYDNVIGYLKGGFEMWNSAQKPIDSLSSIKATQVIAMGDSEEFDILDVRTKSEYNSSHLLFGNVKNISLDELSQSTIGEKPILVHCAGGYRSMIAASLLKQKGYHVVDIQGGFQALEKAGAVCSTFVCPSTLQKEKQI